MGSQWQALLRASDMLRPMGEGKRKWDPKKDTHLGRLRWEKTSEAEATGIEWLLIWLQKQSKTNRSGERQYEKTFLLYNSPEAISVAKAIEHMLYLRNLDRNVDEQNTPLFFDPNTGK